MDFDQFVHLLSSTQSWAPNESYNSWMMLSDFCSQNFNIFLSYFFEILSSGQDSKIKKLCLILFTHLFKSEKNDFQISPEAFSEVIQLVLSTFQLNDYELAGISADLISSFTVQELMENDECPLVLAYAESLKGVSLQSEIYGFSIILINISSLFHLSKDEIQTIFEAITLQLSMALNDDQLLMSYSSIKLLQLFQKIVNKIENSDQLNNFLRILMNIMQKNINNQMISEIFNCWAEILVDFPDYLSFIFQNIVPIALKILNDIGQSDINIQNNEEIQLSVLYFLIQMISDQTAPFILSIIQSIIPILFSIISNESYSYLNDATTLAEMIFSLMLDFDLNQNEEMDQNMFLPLNLLKIVTSQPNSNNFCLLLAYCSIAKSKCDFKNFDFSLVNNMIISDIPKFKFISIRFIRILSKKVLIEPLIYKILENTQYNDEITIENMKLIGNLSIYPQINIENYFDFLIFNFLQEKPELGEIAYKTITKIIQTSNSEKIVMLIPKILICFDNCLSNPCYHEFLINLSTFLQTIAFHIGTQYTPFVEQSFHLILQMGKINEDLLFHTFTPISSISKATKQLPFLEQFCHTMLETLKKYPENGYVIDLIINSFFFLLQEFDLQFLIDQLILIYIEIYNNSKYLKIVSGLNDIFEKYPDHLQGHIQEIVNLFLSIAQEAFDNEPSNDDENDIYNDMCNLMGIILKIFPNAELVPLSMQIIELSNIFVDDINSNDMLIENILFLVFLTSKLSPNDIYQLIQNNQNIKSLILFGLNNENTHNMSQSIINIFGVENI